MNQCTQPVKTFRFTKQHLTQVRSQVLRFGGAKYILGG